MTYDYPQKQKMSFNVHFCRLFIFMIDTATDSFAMFHNGNAIVPMPYCLVLRYDSYIRIIYVQMLDYEPLSLI